MINYIGRALQVLVVILLLASLWHQPVVPTMRSLVLPGTNTTP